MISYSPTNRFNNIFLYLLLIATACMTGCTKSHVHSHDHGDKAHDEEISEVELSKRQMDAVGITIGNIEQKAIGASLRLTGTVEVNPQAETLVASMAPGQITRICVKEGEKVRPGQVIAYVKSTELPRLRQEYLLALNEEKLAKQELDRQNALASQGAGIRKNLENAETAWKMAQVKTQSAAASMRQLGLNPENINENSDGTIPVKCQIGGIVAEISATPGSFADLQSPIARVTDISAAYCMLKVFEKDIPLVKVGQAVDLRLVNNPSIEFTGTVTAVNPVLDPATKTIGIKVTPQNTADTFLLPGMDVSANLDTDNRLTDAVPEDAVVRVGGKTYIFVLKNTVKEEGEEKYLFEKVEVTLGDSALGYVAVTPLQHFSADSKIVTSGAFYLNSMTVDHGEEH